MISILGTPRRLCDGITRRELLRIGGVGTLGLSLDTYLRCRQSRAGVAGGCFGRARACILLFPYGSPPQHETFDPKPQAPAEIQGEMQAIDTSAPGVQICEYLPRVARVMDRVTVIRSMTHPYPLHGVAYATSGIPTYDPSLETRPRDPQLWPYVGSIYDYLLQRRGETAGDVPRHAALPWVLDSKSDLVPLAGPYAGFLGQAHDPIWTEFVGRPTEHALAPKLSDGQTRAYYDPYGGVTPDCYFTFAGAETGGEDLTPQRVGLRRALLGQFDRARAWLEGEEAVAGYRPFREMAFSLVTSPRAREALDVRREPEATRRRYGLTLFGQACLAARRLIEAGTRFVTVFWDCYGIFGGGAWDTHANHFPRLKEQLLPGMDLAYSALIADLDERGLLDETLVIWMSEHGRTPQIDSKPKGAGRHHWSRVYSAVLAGGGVARGRVVGASDRLGGDVQDTPVSPKDILATAYYLLGVDPETIIRDPAGRPFPIAGEGRVRPEVF
ncbi:MAG: DUF1501 domain-containing protein [Pirellulales bacterium]|nr:DUF1501 domain-containing protein [Pirellulales bacterium]